MESTDFYLNRSKMIEFLDRFESGPASGALTMYLEPGSDVKGLPLPPLPEDILAAATTSPNGAVVFQTDAAVSLVLPPFPVWQKAVFDGLETGPLRGIITADYTVGLVLLHLGSYAVGVSKGEILLSSKVGTGLVHGRTRKGGSSSGRFARRRENQAKEFIERVCAHAREQLEPRAKELDYLLYGGPGQTVLQLRKSCPFLKTFDDRTLPLLDVPQLRQKVLETTITRLWSSRVIQWSQDE